MRLRIPNPRGLGAPPLAVKVEMFDLVPGTHMVDVQKVTGSTGAPWGLGGRACRPGCQGRCALLRPAVPRCVPLRRPVPCRLMPARRMAAACCEAEVTGRAPPCAGSAALCPCAPPLAALDVPPAPAAHFHAWYADLAAALASIIAQKQPGAAGELGSAAAAARHRTRREAGGRLRKNAFELIASSFNVRPAGPPARLLAGRPPAVRAWLWAACRLCASDGGAGAAGGVMRAPREQPPGGCSW